MSVDPNNHTTLHLRKFFLFISIFLIAISILAVYSTIAATEYGTKKDDLQSVSLTHLLKSIDWLNDYEEQKLGEKILQVQIDNLNLVSYIFSSCSDGMALLTLPFAINIALSILLSIAFLMPLSRIQKNNIQSSSAHVFSNIDSAFYIIVHILWKTRFKFKPAPCCQTLN